MADRLAGSRSRYLLSHRDDPVDWHPWGEGAFAEAARRDIPVFLSIGYSTCHWCHVMAAESFTDEATARQLNEGFVCVLVDKDARPDIDAVHQAAARALGGGGWPMSVFLTPDRQPFYAGSYWPRIAVGRQPSFRTVLDAIGRTWHGRRNSVRASAQAVAAELAAADQMPAGADRFDPQADADASFEAIRALWDREHGGFGTSPKFPQPMTIEWLLHRHARSGEEEPLQMAVHALTAIARGGIHDLLEGGFARYCTDAAWQLPHFEKMLPDSALLLPAYATAAALTGRADLAAVARGTAEFLLHRFGTAEGTFASAFDADSADGEGGYYRWSGRELRATLTEAGLDAAHWAPVLGVPPAAADADEAGFVPHLRSPRSTEDAPSGDAPAVPPPGWSEVRAVLARRRAGRPAPATDATVLTDWNALAARGLVRAGLALGEAGWIAAAAVTTERLHERIGADGAIGHTGRGDPGFLLDHAATALADLELCQATGDPIWYERGSRLAQTALARFWGERGGWYDTAADELFVRPRTHTDDAVPAGTSVMIEVCLLLAGLSGDLTWRQRALDALSATHRDIQPTRHGWRLRQCEWLSGREREVAIIGPAGPARDVLARIAQGRPRPGTVTVVADSGAESIPLLAGRTRIDGAPAAYVCQSLACRAPVTAAADLRALLAGTG
ncbi:thioredoxin domain-containing protein [Microbacterium kribbense]|uniref:Thioredoxin domain-containing protein n=1 Tax=Microbacterium kribbense TaxID=433645 RepID=A0ABP7GM90_9MICO